MICKAKIVTEGYRTKLFLNDNEVTGLVSLDLSINLDETPTLTLEVRPMELELEIDGVVVERSDSAPNNSLYLTGDIAAILKGLTKASKEGADA